MPLGTDWPWIDVNTLRPKKKGRPQSKPHVPTPVQFADPFGPARLLNAESPPSLLKSVSALSTLKSTVLCALLTPVFCADRFRVFAGQ